MLNTLQYQFQCKHRLAFVLQVETFFVAQADNTKHANTTKNAFLKILIKFIASP